jgi:subtilisin family serine protease
MMVEITITGKMFVTRGALMTSTADPGTSGQNNRISLIQVQYIFQEFGKQAQALATEPADWLENPDQGPIEFIYQRDHVLTTPGDVPRIESALKKLEAQDPKQKVRVVGKSIPVEGLDLVLLELTPVTDLPSILERIEELTGKSVMVSPNHLVSISPATYCPATEPRVPQHPNQEPAVNPPAGFDGKGVKVAVVDTGFVEHAPPHPWMAGVTGESEPPSGPLLGHYSAHGLFAASTIRAIAPEADVHVWRVFADGGNTRFETDLVSDLKNKVLVQNPDIISLSAGTHTWKNRTSLAFTKFVEQVMLRQHPDTILVAAAGNDGVDWVFAPADLAVPHPDRVVSVGALSRNSSRVASFSDRGTWVLVYAQGRDLVQAYADGIYHYLEAQNRPNAQFHGMARWSGTSFATPLVSGLIAARMSGKKISAVTAWNELQQIAQAQPVFTNDVSGNKIPAPRLRPRDANAP